MHISSRFSRNSEAKASELLENLEEMFFLVTDSRVRIMEKWLCRICHLIPPLQTLIKRCRFAGLY